MNALIRLWTRLNLGIEPDPNYLLMHWQHLPLESLNSDFFQSIWSLHSQLPLWNVIIGLYSKLCEADTSCVVHSIFVQHLLFTTLICYCLYKVLALVTRSPTVALISAAMFSLLPSTFYYENYTYYSHATLLLSSWLMYGSAKWLIQKEEIGIAYSAISLSLLALTWTLFHPLFVGILLTFITATAWQTARRTAILAVAAAIIVASLPSFKNQFLYGVFANGSWFGLNIAQVAPNMPRNCSFERFTERAPSDLTVAGFLNDPEVIEASRECLSLAVDSITNHPTEYVEGRVVAAWHSLSKWPTNYLHPPLNWRKFPIGLTEHRIWTLEGEFRWKVAIWRFGIFAFNMASICLLPLLALIAREQYKSFFMFSALYVFTFLFAAYAFNGGEQDRMRYTIQSFLWLSVTIGVLYTTQILRLGSKHRSVGDDREFAERQGAM